jgi:membrane protease YdiL (CAAX protease family)
MAQIVGLVGFVAILRLGDWTQFVPERTGGHIGRVVGQLASGVEPNDDSLPVLWQMASLIPSWVGLLAGTWLFARMLGRATPGWRVEFDPSDLGQGVLWGVLLQIPLIPVLYTLITLIFGELESSGRALALTDRIDSPIKVIAIFLFVAVGAPVVEELFYRGLVQARLVDRFGPTVGIGIASLIFGAVHFSWVELPALTLVGVVLGWLAWRSGRLAPAIIAHMTFNAFTLITLLVA